MIEDLVGGIDVFEPYLAGMGRGGGVGGEVVVVGCVPAWGRMLACGLFEYGGLRVGGTNLLFFRT